MKKILKEKEGYGMVQRDFMQMPISVYAKCVYTLLRTYSGQNNACYPSMKTICEDLNISKSTLIRSIKELEKINMIAVKRSKKDGSNESSVNTYIPLSIMVEIDIDNPDSYHEDERLGGTPQTPRGTPQTPGVVSEMDRKNNSYKNNKEEDLNIITEQSSVQNFQKDLFGEGELQLAVKNKKEKKEKSVRQKIIEFWLKDFHVGWNFNSTDGKKLDSIIVKLEKTLRLNGNIINDESVLNLFKVFCYKLPEFYKNETLSTLDSKYDSIVETIKSNKNGKQQQYKSTATNVAESINFFKNL